MLQRDKLVKNSGVVVQIAWVMNRIFATVVGTGLLLSLVFHAALSRIVEAKHPGGGFPAEMNGLRWMMLLGIVMAFAIDRLLRELRQIIETTRAGDPFIAANARRLRTIGWMLAALQLMDVPASLIERTFPNHGLGSPDPAFSVAGWMAVLMVFVLSRVFAAGAAMRDELEGTI